MRYLYSWPALLAALALLAGCQKDAGQTTISGQVVERTTGQPVAGTRVQLQALPSAGAYGGFQPVGEPQPTDALGRFSFAAQPPGGMLIVMASSPLGYYSIYGEVPEIRPGRRNDNLRLPVQAPAWLRFRFIDELPKSRVWIFVGGYSSSANNVRLTFPRDTVVLRPVEAWSKSRVTWEILDMQAVKRQYSQDINIPALDTLTVDIRF